MHRVFSGKRNRANDHSELKYLGSTPAKNMHIKNIGQPGVHIDIFNFLNNHKFSDMNKSRKWRNRWAKERENFSANALMGKAKSNGLKVTGIMTSFSISNEQVNMGNWKHYWPRYFPILFSKFPFIGSVYWPDLLRHVCIKGFKAKLSIKLPPKVGIRMHIRKLNHKKLQNHHFHRIINWNWSAIYHPKTIDENS